MDKVTVILMTHNRKDILMDAIEWLENVEGISDIIIVDNGSEDMTAEWLSEQKYGYVYFDEGAQGYGKVWNTVLENFETEEYVVFLEAGIYPVRDAFIRLVERLRVENVGIASVFLNLFNNNDNYVRIQNKDEFMEICQNGLYLTNEAKYEKTLTAEWKMWMFRKETYYKVGAFREDFMIPEIVLTDYMLRLVKNGFHQIFLEGLAYSNVPDCEKIYNKTLQWAINDKKNLKSVWGVTYFSLKHNPLLVECIQEEREKEFSVLEIGCNFGATLFAIEDQYPNCKTYGLEINEAAVDVAKHIANVKYGNIDELKVPFTEKFDYIIFGDVLEHLRHPKEVIDMCHEILNEDGHIIASIPNIMHISVIEGLIDGRFIYEDVGLLDKTHIHFFTYYEILQMFMDTHYEMEYITGNRIGITDRQKTIEQTLLNMSEHTEEWMYEIFQYLVKVRQEKKKVNE